MSPKKDDFWEGDFETVSISLTKAQKKVLDDWAYVQTGSNRSLMVQKLIHAERGREQDREKARSRAAKKREEACQKKTKTRK